MADTSLAYETEEVLSDQAGRFLTFTSDNLIFGVSTDNVIEIITNYMIRPLPLVPDYIRGVINLRGQIIPVMDMRLRLGKPFIEYTATTCIIILEIQSVFIGIVVDSVLQVQNIHLEAASPIPIENHQELTNSMLSMEDGTVVLLLDCEAVLGV